MMRLLILVSMLSSSPAFAQGWGIYYPTRAEGDRLPQELIRHTPPGDPQGGEIVMIVNWPFLVDPWVGVPLDYDRATREARPWQTEIDRRTAGAQATAQDASRLRAASTALDQLNTLRSSTGTLTSAQRDQALRLIADVLYRLLRHEIRQAGGQVPAEPIDTPTPGAGGSGGGAAPAAVATSTPTPKGKKD